MDHRCDRHRDPLDFHLYRYLYTNNRNLSGAFWHLQVSYKHLAYRYLQSTISADRSNKYSVSEEERERLYDTYIRL